MKRQAPHASEHARRYVHRGKREPSDQPLDKQTDLQETSDLRDQMDDADMNEHRGAEAPPLAIGRARPDAAAPIDERAWVAEDATTRKKQDEDDEVGDDDGGGDERPLGSRLHGSIERLASFGRLRNRVLDEDQSVDDGLPEFQPLLRRHASQHETKDHRHEDEDGDHVS